MYCWMRLNSSKSQRFENFSFELQQNKVVKPTWKRMLLNQFEINVIVRFGYTTQSTNWQIDRRKFKNKKNYSHSINGFGNFYVQLLLLYFRSATPFWNLGRVVGYLSNVCIYTYITCVCACICITYTLDWYSQNIHVLFLFLCASLQLLQSFDVCITHTWNFQSHSTEITHYGRTILFFSLSLYSFNLPHQYLPSYYPSFHYLKGVEICF